MFGHIDKIKQRMWCQYFVVICRYGPGRRFFDSAGIVCVIRDLQSMILKKRSMCGWSKAIRSLGYFGDKPTEGS